MANLDDLLTTSLVDYKAHIQRRFIGKEKLLEKFWMFQPDHENDVKNDPKYKFRFRASTTSGLAVDSNGRIEDGVKIVITTRILFDRYKETIDTLYGKDPQGHWLGGPYISFTTEGYNGHVGPRDAQQWTNPAYLQPPITENTFTSYFLDAPGRYGMSILDVEENISLNISSASVYHISDLTAKAYGRVSGARNSSRPEAPAFQALNSLVELRELPDLIRTSALSRKRGRYWRASQFAGRTASAILSIEFGWVTLTRDLRKLITLAADVEKRLEFLSKSEGKPIYRTRSLYVIEKTFPDEETAPWPFDPSYRTIGQSAGSSIKTSTSYRAEARYHSRVIYHGIPDFSIPKERTRAQLVLSGLSLNEATLWNSIPWTWLIDWVSNLGDILQERYGEKLAEATILDEWITIHAQIDRDLAVPLSLGSQFFENSQGTPAGTAKSRRSSSIKWRGLVPQGETPIIFDNPFELSKRQQTILAALLVLKSRLLRLG